MDIVIYKKPLAQFLKNYSFTIPELGVVTFTSEPIIKLGKTRHPISPTYNLLITFNTVTFKSTNPWEDMDDEYKKQINPRKHLSYRNSTIKLSTYAHIVDGVLNTFMFTNHAELNIDFDIKIISHI